jgi:hypothetical protein
MARDDDRILALELVAQSELLFRFQFPVALQIVLRALLVTDAGMGKYAQFGIACGRSENLSVTGIGYPAGHEG